MCVHRGQGYKTEEVVSLRKENLLGLRIILGASLHDTIWLR